MFRSYVNNSFSIAALNVLNTAKKREKNLREGGQCDTVQYGREKEVKNNAEKAPFE